MFNYHPKLVSIMTEQTPRAMMALFIVALVYFWIFIKYVPVTYLMIWIFFQALLVLARLYNAKTLDKYIKTSETQKIKQHVIYFVVLIIVQASMWSIASFLCILYAPQPFELVTLVTVIGIITGAVLSMSSLFFAYLIFFFLMIIPQIIIMIYFGTHQHIALILLTLIYIPTIALLSKSTYISYLSAIESNELLETNVNKLHKLSIEDSLTQIYNRRYFFETAEKVLAMAKREKTVISLLMIDIDHFKKINDDFGHRGGDDILIEFAKEINDMMRKSDIFARFGGEEFIILLYNTELKNAKFVAEKIRKRIEEKTFTINHTGLNITISVGTSVLDATSTSIDLLYKQADKQLYKAKDEGRNRVC